MTSTTTTDADRRPGLSRRDLVKIGVAGGAAMAIPFQRSAFSATTATRLPTSAMPKQFTLPFVRPPELGPADRVSYVCPDGVTRTYPRYSVQQRFAVAEIMPGYRTPVFAYNGVTPGPTLRVDKGSAIVVDQANLLHQPPPSYPNAPMPSRYTTDPMQRTTSTHLHGSASLPQFDGYASDITKPSWTKRYFYPNSQEARTLWYHDHAVHHTSQNAYNGLAGMYILHDPEEQSLGIPQGEYDVPLVIRDAMFATNGSLIYDDNSESGVFGDVILINGVPWPEMVVERRKYRFRFLNASVARSYSWSLVTGGSRVPMTMIGTDAGLMYEPQVVSSFRHSMAERYEVVIDFAAYPDNTLLTLRNASPTNNIDYSTTAAGMRFRVRGDAATTANNRIYAAGEVRKPECMTFKDAELKAKGVKEREFKFIRTNGMWTINGETWENVIDSQYTYCMAEMKEGDVEIWKLTNTSGGWFHPVHIHLVDFQVLTRNGSAANVRAFEKGPKDVVYVGENETVRVAMRFNGTAAGPGWPTPKGRYMMHCHNLVHEDHDMMMQFSVGDPDRAIDYDPIKGAPARPL